MESGFVKVFKRHTPFAMSNYNQTITNGTIKLDKVGDILMYMYLYTDIAGFDWKNNIKSVKFYIGGQLINTWDTTYLIDFEPSLVSKRHNYREGMSFLPIPIHMLPVKNLQYHEIEIIIDNVTLESVSCHVMYAFVDEVLPPSTEIFLQIDKYTIGSEPFALYGSVKFMVSGDIQQPDILKLDGHPIKLAPLDVYRYNHVDYDTKWGFSDPNSYLSFDVLDPNLTPLTSQLIGKNIIIFSSTQPNALVYDSTLFFGSKRSYTTLPLLGPVWTSATDGTDIFAASIDGVIMRITKDLNVENMIQTGFRVYKMYYFNTNLIIIGDSSATIFSPSTYESSPTYTWEGRYSVDFFDGGRYIYVYSKDGDVLTRINTLTFLVETNLFNDVVQTTGYENYDQFSQSIMVNGDVYYSPGRGSLFKKNDEEYQLPANNFSSLIYDGKEYIYLFPYVGSTIVRYSMHMKYSTLIPFCLCTNGIQPSGGLNMGSFKNVEFEPKSQGTLYVARYNFLCIQNGMAGKLFC
jgi:hypothetical protein